MTPDMASFQTVEEANYTQEPEDIHPVTLLATSNGTHIAVQVIKPTWRDCNPLNVYLLLKQLTRWIWSREFKGTLHLGNNKDYKQISRETMGESEFFSYGFCLPLHLDVALQT